METLTGYIYNVESKLVIEEVNGTRKQIEDYAGGFDINTYGLTFGPAFGFNGGLVDNKRPVIDL